MENLESYKKRLKAIEELANRIENGELAIDELGKLETLTRELYERSVILKYKAFENKVNPIAEGPLNLEDEIDYVEETVEYETEIEKDEPTIDFSIFDAPTEEEEKEEASVVKEEVVIEKVMEEKVVAPVTEKTPEVPKVEVKSIPAANGISFWEQLNIKDNSLSTQFEGAKLDTLIGAFGLNEKLRYINDLFDGSSESFSEAVKILDTQSNLEQAKMKSSELAVKHAWNAEEESVVDFLIMVNRRYA